LPKYLVHVTATNYLVEFDGLVGKSSFITFRRVHAENAEEAELAGVRMLCEDQRLNAMIKNDDSDRPRITVTEIVEVDAFNVENQPGLIWYDVPQKKRWWQFWKR
jgi:hypothetical protein